MRRVVGGLSLLLLASVAFAQPQPLPLETIKLPPGFKIELLARVDNAREMALGAKGTLSVGVAFHGGALYVSAVDRIVRFDDIESRLTDPPKAVIVSDRFPKETQHGWKFIAFGPDGKLYVPVGAPCNVCDPDPDRFAAIMRMNADGSGLETFARGIRNTVGFAWDPRTRELWFTDNGRDWLGDDWPPNELNHA